MLADYDTTGLTVGAHPLARARAGLPRGTLASRELTTQLHGTRVRVGGLVVARQRPSTASGIVFMLIEDEHGTVNLVVRPELYERSRLTVRTEPLVLVEGRLERHPAAGGGINVLVERIAPLELPDRPLAQVRELPAPVAEQHEPASVDDFRAVAPAVMSFGSGRRP
ncbi:MAG: OB-fold nucleic acid binding domain-containing protein, partial [Conexibacter sp.]